MNFLEKFGIDISNKELLNVALTHSSYSNEHNVENYERLEFLGDSVLQLIMSEYFYLNSNMLEGEMSKKRASFVCEEALFEYSKMVGIDKFINLGNGQSKDLNETIIADCFESVLGVIFLEKGYDVAKKYVYDIIIPYVEKDYQFLVDYKSKLQEMVQTDKKSLEYVLVNESGPAHNKTFEVEVRIDNIIYGVGQGKSKKSAEQNAALDAFNKCVKK